MIEDNDNNIKVVWKKLNNLKLKLHKNDISDKRSACFLVHFMILIILLSLFLKMNLKIPIKYMVVFVVLNVESHI